MQIIDPGQAYWEQRHALKEMCPRIQQLRDTIDAKVDFTSYQWAQITAFMLSFKPDCIIELGRGNGNSTACFLEVAHRLTAENNPCKVVSVCWSEEWEKYSLPRLQSICTPQWSAPLQAIRGDILAQDYRKLIGDSKRVALFWDAHGFTVAGCVLGSILPMIADRDHVVMMHDMADQRYLGPEHYSYNGNPLWSGGNNGTPKYILGYLQAGVEQAIAITDFVSRNKIPFDSADFFIHNTFDNDAMRRSQMQELIGDEFFQTHCQWFWFTLNGKQPPIHFPAFNPPQG